MGRYITSARDIRTHHWYAAKIGGAHPIDVLVLDPHVTWFHKERGGVADGFSALTADGGHLLVCYSEVGIPALCPGSLVEGREATNTEIATATTEAAFHTRESLMARTCEIAALLVTLPRVSGISLYGSLARWTDGHVVHDADVGIEIPEDLILFHAEVCHQSARAPLGIHSPDGRLNSHLVGLLEMPEGMNHEIESILRGHVHVIASTVARVRGNPWMGRRDFKFDVNLFRHADMTPEIRDHYSAEFLRRVREDIRLFDPTTSTFLPHEAGKIPL